jgi:hypothetical protein
MSRERPLCVDLFCGLFGWSAGFVQEGWDVVGFDLEDMHAKLGIARAPEFRLVIQDAMTLHGSQFRNADCIAASPPCQRYSWMAMPWSRAKAAAAAIRADETGAELERLNRLFNACFRIQREACEAAGRHIPLVVENVKGAIPWVGRSRWNFGSYHLWGDVPALMPATIRGVKGKPYETGNKNDGGSWFAVAHNTTSGHSQNPDGRKVPGFRFDGSGRSFQSASVAETGVKAPGMNWIDRSRRGQDFTRIAGKHAADGRKADGTGRGRNHDHPFGWSPPTTTSKGTARKAASAMIAKIPLALSTHIARTFLPGGYGVGSSAA